MDLRRPGRAAVSRIAFFVGSFLAITAASQAPCAEIHRLAGEGDLEAVKQEIAEDPERVNTF